MKKLIIALLLMGSIFANTFAQEYDDVEAGEMVDFNNNEMYFSAGIPSFIGLFSGMFVALGEAFAEALSDNNEEGNSKKSNDSAFSVAGGYNYYFTENFGLGAMATYEKIASISLLSLQAKITAQYGWEHFKIYHAASAGIMFIPGASAPNLIFDITYLGLKLDFEDWNVFVDASFPSTGIIKAGASYKF